MRTASQRRSITLISLVYHLTLSTTNFTMASLSKILLQDSTLKAALNVSSSKLPSKLLQSSAALFSAHASGASSAIVLPDLPYDYSALEPVISGETMKIHHTKHHATYVNNLNAALEKLGDAVQGSDVAQVIALQAALRFNGGGHLNHSLFWENLKAPTTSSDGNSNVPSAGGALDAAITESFGSVEGLKKEMSDKTIAIQGRFV
jgi:Fe-Mn family superoxide dismutase